MWLKTKHGFGTSNAWWIAERVDGKNTEEESPEEYLKAAVMFVDEQYAGRKESLRALHDELLKMGKAIGADVKACPCNGAAVSRTCVCADQADDEYAD